MYFFCWSTFLFSAFWKYFPALSPSEPAWMCQFPRWELWTLRQYLAVLSHSSVHHWRADSWQCFTTWPMHRNERECAQLPPHSNREVQQSRSCRMPLFPWTMCGVGAGTAELCSDRGGWTSAPSQGLYPPLLGSQPLHMPWDRLKSGLTPNRCWVEWVTPSAPIKRETALNFSRLNSLLAADLVSGWRGNNNFVLMSC